MATFKLSTSVALLSLCVCSAALAAIPEFSPAVLVTDMSGAIDVPGYSVPSLTDWNNDGKLDLVVGEGSGTVVGKVRLYLNRGSAAEPLYTAFSYIEVGGVDLQLIGSGCLGVFPRVVDWDGDARKDLLVGMSDGRMMVYANEGVDAAPVFNSGALVTAGASALTVDVGSRATPSVVDWNSDGRPDLVAGCYSGDVKVYLNSADSGAPVLGSALSAQTTGGTLFVPSIRSSAAIFDLDGDGAKDLLAGNTNGELLAYLNVGADAAPIFPATATYLQAGGVKIDLSSRSRPWVGDYNDDGIYDILVGASDGNVHLYTGVPEPATCSLLALGAVGLMRRRRRVF